MLNNLMSYRDKRTLEAFAEGSDEMGGSAGLSVGSETIVYGYCRRSPGCFAACDLGKLVICNEGEGPYNQRCNAAYRLSPEGAVIIEPGSAPCMMDLRQEFD